MYQLEKAQVCLLSKIIHTACSQFLWQCSTYTGVEAGDLEGTGSFHRYLDNSENGGQTKNI